MPKFSLQLAFASTTLIVLGVAFLFAVARTTNPAVLELGLIIWWLGHCFIGGGLTLIFKRPHLGIILGTFISMIDYGMLKPISFG